MEGERHVGRTAGTDYDAVLVKAVVERYRSRESSTAKAKERPLPTWTMTQADGVAIRAMQAHDAPGVVEMARELATAVGDPRPSISESDLVSNGFGPDRWFDCLIAEISDRLVGYALVSRAFEAHTGKKRLWLGDLYVRPAARRSGAGSALMITIARQALHLGCHGVYWELWRMNVAGAAFYRKLRAEEATDLAVMRLDKDILTALAAGHTASI